MKKRIGVVLSGCGVFDGSEIHEAVFTLLAIDTNNAEAVCMAPDMEFPEVNHLTGKATGAKRNALVESARIARGKIRCIREVKAADLDAIIFPGGFGTMDELFESVTLIQTHKIKPFPVILLGSDYWKGLLDWIRKVLLKEGKISASDLDIFQIIDTPEEIVRTIKKTVIV